MRSVTYSEAAEKQDDVSLPPQAEVSHPSPHTSSLPVRLLIDQASNWDNCIKTCQLSKLQSFSISLDIQIYLFLIRTHSEKLV